VLLRGLSLATEETVVVASLLRLGVVKAFGVTDEMDLSRLIG
jgi:hypothetical protein